MDGRNGGKISRGEEGESKRSRSNRAGGSLLRSRRREEERVLVGWVRRRRYTTKRGEGGGSKRKEEGGSKRRKNRLSNLLFAGYRALKYRIPYAFSRIPPILYRVVQRAQTKQAWRCSTTAYTCVFMFCPLRAVANKQQKRVFPSVFLLRDGPLLHYWFFVPPPRPSAALSRPPIPQPTVPPSLSLPLSLGSVPIKPAS